MKLKKILASLTAAALAVTTMAFASVGVSAAVLLQSVQLGSTGWNSTLAADEVTINFEGAWGARGWYYGGVDFSAYDEVAVTFSGNTVPNGIALEIAYMENENSTSMGAYTTDSSGELVCSLDEARKNSVKQIVVKCNDTGSGSVKIESAEARASADTRAKLELTYDGSPVTMEKSYPDWGMWSPVDGTAQGMIALTPDGINLGEITYGQLKAAYKSLDIPEFEYVSDSLNVGESAFSYCLYAKAGTDRSIWLASSGTSLSSPIKWETNSFSNASLTDDSVIMEIGIQINMADNNNLPEAVKNLSAGETFVLNPAASTPATSITLAPTSLSFKLGDAAKPVTATVEPANTTDTVEWSIDNDTVASIEASPDGLSCKVTPKAAGTATITAKANAGVSTTCAVTVEENTYAISVKSNDDTYGTASADKTEAAEGEKVKLKATPNTGYKFVEWKSDEVTVTNNAFTMPAEAVTVTAVFAEKEADEFDIVVTENDYGSVVVEGGLTAAKAGDEINLIVTPNEGIELEYISVNGKIIEGTSFVMPAEDITISATFTASTYNIEVEVSKGGTASADKTTAVMGETVNITVKPDDGYDLSYIKVNGTKISGTSFTMPAENVKVVVAFYKLIECNISMPEDVSVDVDFVSSKEEIFAATFGNDYEGLTENHTLSVELHVGGESVVSAEDKALVEAALAPNQKVGLYLDLSLYKKIDDKTEMVRETIAPISLSIGVPDSIIADGRTYSVMRVHDGKAENIGGTFDSVKKALTVSSNLFSTYAIVYEDSSKPQVKPAAQSEPVPVVYYSIAADRNVTVSTSSAPEGTVIDVKSAFGYDAYVYCGSQRLMKFTGRGSFVMPAGNVTIVSEENGYLAMIRNAAPNSYIFVYDADMNYIKTNGSVKGIAGEGKITVKLGEEYAGKTVTLYKGRKSTSVKLDSKTLDENGNATFTVEGGKNYTAVVE